MVPSCSTTLIDLLGHRHSHDIMWQLATIMEAQFERKPLTDDSTPAQKHQRAKRLLIISGNVDP